MARTKRKQNEQEQVTEQEQVQEAPPEETKEPVDGRQFDDVQQPPQGDEVASQSGDEDTVTEDAVDEGDAEDEFQVALAEALGEGPDPNNYRAADSAEALGFVQNPVAGGANPYQRDTSREFVNGVDHEPASEAEDEAE